MAIEYEIRHYSLIVSSWISVHEYYFHFFNGYWLVI